MPPLHYASSEPEEVPYTNETLYSEKQHKNITKEIVQPESYPLPTQMLHHAETCGLPVEISTPETSIPPMKQSTVHKTSGQPSTPAPTSRTPTVSRFPPFRLRITASSLKPQFVSSRSSARSTQQTTRRSTKRPRITSISRKPVLTSRFTQKTTSRFTQKTTRITPNQAVTFNW